MEELGRCQPGRWRGIVGGNVLCVSLLCFVFLLFSAVWYWFKGQSVVCWMVGIIYIFFNALECFEIVYSFLAQLIVMAAVPVSACL